MDKGDASRDAGRDDIAPQVYDVCAVAHHERPGDQNRENHSDDVEV
jgi:hypothetical protein